jgi:hypothetical protein
MQNNEMQIFFFNESYIRDGEEVQLSLTKTPNSQMQFSKCNLYYTTQKKECNYLLCLILIYKESKCKSFNASLLSIKMKESNADTKDTKKKGFQTKHALTG